MGFPCGKGVAIPNKTPGLDLLNSVGAALSLFYAPGGNSDPPVDPSLHWIQIVTRTGDGLVGKKFIDNPSRSALRQPFYPLRVIVPDSNTGSDLFGFLDAPQTSNFRADQDWTAQLFLAREITTLGSGSNQPRTVELYKGLSWGWKSRYTSATPNNPPPAPPSKGKSLGLGGCPAPPYSGGAGSNCSLGSYGNYSDSQNALAAAITNFDEVQASSFTEEPLLATDDAAGVPEPNTMLGTLVAVGVWSGVSWRKRKIKTGV